MTDIPHAGSIKDRRTSFIVGAIIAFLGGAACVALLTYQVSANVAAAFLAGGAALFVPLGVFCGMGYWAVGIKRVLGSTR